MPKVSQTELVAAAIAGKVVSFPTDTVPALGVLPEDSSLIFATKKRTLDKPLILMGASAEDLWHYVTGTVEELEIWQQVAQDYWGGELTLVLPASHCVPAVMNLTNSMTIGLRVPNHFISQTILSQTGPLATTSANLSGEPPLETMTAIAEAFPDVFVLNCDILEKGKKLGNGLPSTVAKWTGIGWEILRQGRIKL